MPSKQDLQHLMTATRRFVNLGEWALDLASDVDGPVTAEAFLRQAMKAVGVKAGKAPSHEGPRHKAAGTSCLLLLTRSYADLCVQQNPGRKGLARFSPARNRCRQRIGLPSKRRECQPRVTRCGFQAHLADAYDYRYSILFTELGQLLFANGQAQQAAADERGDLRDDEDAMATPLTLGTKDLGVDKWAGTTPERLMTALGFLNGRPALFAPWKSKSGDHDAKSVEDIPADDREPLGLLWHQAVADAAMTECFWTETPIPGGSSGVLLADNVGLGKTVEIMGLIAMIVQTRKSEQQVGGVRAPIIGECCFLLHSATR